MSLYLIVEHNKDESFHTLEFNKGTCRQLKALLSLFRFYLNLLLLPLFCVTHENLDCYECQADRWNDGASCHSHIFLNKMSRCLSLQMMMNIVQCWEVNSGYESLQCHQMASEKAWLYVCVCHLLRTPTYLILGANGYLSPSSEGQNIEQDGQRLCWWVTHTPTVVRDRKAM